MNLRERQQTANKECNQFGLNGLGKQVGTQGTFLTWDKSQPRTPKLVILPAVHSIINKLFISTPTPLTPLSHLFLPFPLLYIFPICLQTAE